MKTIGQPFDRVDARLKVTGQAHYVAEIAHSNMTYAVLVQSTIAHGRIVQFDLHCALSVPGVLAILTHENVPRLTVAAIIFDTSKPQSAPGSAGQRYLPLQDDCIHYLGQHIAVVVAESFEQATYAASLVQVEYAQETPRLDPSQAPDTIITPADVWGEPSTTEKGSLAQGLHAADVCIDQVYTTVMQHHNTMEPHATMAVWEDHEHLTLYEPSTWVYGTQQTVASWFGLPVENVRVVQYFVGGSFGSKGPAWPHVALTALAAQRVGRPVRLVLTRQQTYTSVGYRPEIQHHIQLGATYDGHLTAIEHAALAQTSDFDNRAVAPVTKTTRKLYACPNVATSYRLALLNLPGPFTMRGPGETPGMFAVESALDELSYALHLDPLDLRLRNYAERDPENDLPWSSKLLRECYLQGAERFGWQKRNSQPATNRVGDHFVGWGMATAAYDARMLPASASARMFADGSVLLESATCDQGTGSYTTMAQIGAQALGLSLREVRFALGDTHMPRAPISAGSMTSASVGSAVDAAAHALRGKLIALALEHPASPLFGLSEEQIDCEDGFCFAQADLQHKLSFVDILRLHEQESVMVQAHTVSPELAEQYSCYTFGAHFVEVTVDAATAEVRVTRYVAAFATGRILNPKTAHSQLLGGIIWGIGMALMEKSSVDPQVGRITNANLADYHVPVHADIPPIDAFFIEELDSVVNDLQVKGLGEIGTVGSAAAIANAVYHATGKRIRDLPITPDKLFNAQREAM